MNVILGLKAVACLRRIARAVEGIERQLQYQNERSFPPMRPDNEGRKKTVITRGKADATSEER